MNIRPSAATAAGDRWSRLIDDVVAGTWIDPDTGAQIGRAHV